MLLSSCATTTADHTPPSAPNPTTSASEAASLPAGTIGSGTFHNDIDNVGTLTFTATGDLMTLNLQGLQTPTSAAVSVFAVVDPVSDDVTCLDSGFRMAFAQVQAGDSSADFGIDIVSGDPSAIDQVILTTTPSIPAGDCLAEIAARAEVEWTFAPLRESLRAVDSGKTGGARGKVTLADGVPATYTVAPNDLIEEVAARLGLTADDLFYLNPARLPSPKQLTLRVGEVFNLLVDRR
jgi:hypothetical protein